jgi:bacteriophage N4 adsorption protein B
LNVLQSDSDALGLLIAALAVAFLISGLDDLIIDLCYCMRRLSRRSPTSRVLPQISLGGEERPIAIMVPAWHEHDVIYSMVRTNRNHIDYIDYTFFIGVYQNDPATLVEALRAREAFPNVVVSIVPHDGPTCKADCLNVLVAAIATHERASGRLFAGVALHDSEDVIHPLELKLFNNLNDFYDFIQLPVYSFRRSPRHFVAGTYMDEFAEFHTKDLEVRNSFPALCRAPVRPLSSAASPSPVWRSQTVRYSTRRA